MFHRLTKKGRVKAFFCFLFLVLVVGMAESRLKFPERIVLYEGENLPESNNLLYSLNANVPVGKSGVLTQTGTLSQDAYTPDASGGGDYDMTLKLFGVIPVRSVAVDVQPKKELVASGKCIGIKIFTKGLVCVGVQPVKGENGNLRDVSKEQDIRAGDIFLTANGENLSETEQMSKIVGQSGGKKIDLRVLRDEKEILRTIEPVKTEDGYQLGFWLRDSTAGIGTLTYYDPETMQFGALGHPITDSDTGVIMPVSDGTVLEASILGINKGERGEPGELKGVFGVNKPAIGTIRENTGQGIFGEINKKEEMEKKFQIISKNNVEMGRATIISNITGNEVESFEVEIQKHYDLFGGHKDMVIHVTDPDLLERTGGIVQGMSGSPVIQNGKLVGAVTHVFVNDPTRGYGIFIENMLAEAEKIK